MTIFIKICFNNIMLVETSRLQDGYGERFDSEMYKKPIHLLNDLLTDKTKLDTTSKYLTTLEKIDDLKKYIILLNNERFMDSNNCLLKGRRIVFDRVENGDIEYLNCKF